MPMLEVIHGLPEAPGVAAKRAFAEEAAQIFREVLGTPPGRLRLFYRRVDPEDTIECLLAPGPGGPREDRK